MNQKVKESSEALLLNESIWHSVALSYFYLPNLNRAIINQNQQYANVYMTLSQI